MNEETLRMYLDLILMELESLRMHVAMEVGVDTTEKALERIRKIRSLVYLQGQKGASNEGGN